MNSCLYRCSLAHARSRPKQHRFTYQCFMFFLDMDELDMLHRSLRFFSRNRGNLYSLRDSDHLQEGKQSIKENLKAYLSKQGEKRPLKRVSLLTNLRTFGYIFNPVSFYFAYGEDDELLCIVAEVGNTFGEHKLYYISQSGGSKGSFKQSLPKLFYISPFSQLDTHLDFRMRAPGKSLQLGIDEHDSEGTYFISQLNGKRLPLTSKSLAHCTLRFPFMTLGVIAGINWQALKLYLKKVPFIRKKDNPELQTQLRRFDASASKPSQP